MLEVAAYLARSRNLRVPSMGYRLDSNFQAGDLPFGVKFDRKLLMDAGSRMFR